MSWHVEHGYRVPAALRPTDLVRDLAARVAPVLAAHEETALAVVSLALLTDPGVLDAVSWGVLPVGDAPTVPGTSRLRAACSWYATAVAEADRRDARLPAVLDGLFAVTFVTDPEDRDWTYALCYTDNTVLRDVWASTVGVEPYGYQDATDDLPDGVSWDERETRGRRWRVLCDEAPARVGLTWTAPLPRPGRTLSDGIAGRVAARVHDLLTPSGRTVVGPTPEDVLAALTDRGVDGPAPGGDPDTAWTDEAFGLAGLALPLSRLTPERAAERLALVSALTGGTL